LLSQATRTNVDTANEPHEAADTPLQEEREAGDASRPITGQIVAIAQDAVQPAVNSQPMGMSAPASEGSPDKLQMTIEILRANPEISDEILAAQLSLKRPASALFWRRKAIEILNAQDSNGQVQSTYNTETWAKTAGTNGKH
jgi:hypothetical protein